MKILTTSLLIAALSITTIADETVKNKLTFEQKQEKVLNRIDSRITKITTRQTCVQNAASLEQLQSCRTKEPKGTPKNKKGISVEAKKEKILKRISQRLTKVNGHKTCVQNALDKKTIRACRPAKKKK